MGDKRRAGGAVFAGADDDDKVFDAGEGDGDVGINKTAAAVSGGVRFRAGNAAMGGVSINRAAVEQAGRTDIV